MLNAGALQMGGTAAFIWALALVAGPSYVDGVLSWTGLGDATTDSLCDMTIILSFSCPTLVSSVIGIIISLLYSTL